MDPALNVFGNFEGGNPQDAGSIVRLGDVEFAVYPFSEDNDPGYKFRLDLIVANTSDEVVETRVKLHWDDERFIDYRKVVRLRSGDMLWRSCEGRVDGTDVVVDIQAPPGETYVTLNPGYSYQDYINLVERYKRCEFISAEVKVRTAGKRDVWVLKRNGSRSKPTVLVTARTHPYETGGSYCVEGVLREIERVGMSSFEGVDLHIVPMVCPDGVAGGMCRLDSVGGEDLARSGNVGNPVIHGLHELVDTIRPDFIIDFHNWMLPHTKGMFYERPSWMRKVARRLDQLDDDGEKWHFGIRRRFFAKRPMGFKSYAQRRYRSRCMTVEFSWRDCTAEHMMQRGVNMLSVVTELIAG